MNNNFVLSLIRTLVPKLVAAILGGLAAIGIVGLDEAEWVLVFVGLAEAGYYALFRALEHRWPLFGWFLGHSAKPSYVGEHEA